MEAGVPSENFHGRRGVHPPRRVWRAGFLLVFVTLLSLTACRPLPPRIGLFKLGKDDPVTIEASAFAPNDPVCALVSVDHVSGKVTLLFELVADAVPNIAPHYHPASFDKTVELSPDANATYVLMPLPTGWKPGKYHIEAHLGVDGEERDFRSAAFTVQAP